MDNITDSESGPGPVSGPGHRSDWRAVPGIGQGLQVQTTQDFSPCYRHLSQTPCAGRPGPGRRIIVRVLQAACTAVRRPAEFPLAGRRAAQPRTDGSPVTSACGESPVNHQ